MPFTFRFRLIPFVGATMAVILGLSLGQWQMRRAAEKQAIELRLTARVDAPPITLSALPVAADAVEYRRVVVRGEFIREWPVYLDNRPQHGVAGMYMLMPFKIEGSNQHVVIMRGWIPRNMSDRTRLPLTETSAETREIQGVARRNSGHLLQLGQAEKLRPKAIVQNVAIEEFSAASKLSFQPFFIEQMNDTGDGLVRDWPRPSSGIEKHHGYAFQWFGLAAMAFIFFVATGFRRGKK